MNDVALFSLLLLWFLVVQLLRLVDHFNFPRDLLLEVVNLSRINQLVLLILFIRWIFIIPLSICSFIIPFFDNISPIVSLSLIIDGIFVLTL